jgi:hypothetical protein
MTVAHEMDVEEINLLQCEVESETVQIVKKVAAEKRKAVKLVEAENILKLAKLRADTEAVNADNRA